MAETNSCLEARSIAFAYPGGKPVFEDISLELRPGESVCILGPNGSGKTTLLNCLANLAAVSSGSIYLNGKAISRMPAKEVAKHVGYVPQMILPSFDFSVLDYVVTGCAPRMKTFEKPGKEHYELAEQAIVDMGIEHLMHKSYSHISGGERQQVSIARALAQKPSFILMDEPTAHLDYGNQIKVLNTIRRLVSQGFGVLLTTHNPDYCLLLDEKVAILNRSGRLCFGTCRELFSEELLTSLYDTPLKLVKEDCVNRQVCIAPRLEDMGR